MTTVPTSLSSFELVGLWHGDAEVTGYMHPEIVVAVCEKSQPANVDVVFARFYPKIVRAQVDEDAALILEHGYSVWKERKRRAA